MKNSPNISRRAFLGGSGAILALPFLESLVPRVALAANPIPRRLLTFFVPNGINMETWTPVGRGTDFTVSPTLAPLAPFRDDILVLSGLANTPAGPEGSGGHAAGTAGSLTCRSVNKSEGADIRNGVSVDQLASQRLTPDTAFPSMQLGTDGGGNIGNCDSGYSCAYVRNISWAGETTPLQKLADPQVVFDRMFAGNDPLATRYEKEKRRRYNKSILDYVLGDAKRLHHRLGGTDRRKVDEYMTGIRELETRITRPPPLACAIDALPEEDLEFPERTRVMCDLIVTAFQCDLTRIISFMLGNGITNRSFSFLGATGGHHELSHHQHQPDKLEKLSKIDLWEMQQFAYIVERLKSIEEGGGSALDNSVLLFLSEMGNGDNHSQVDLPYVIAGSGGGAFTTGRHVVYEEGEPTANMHISILQAMGVDVSTFGDNGTGPLHSMKV